MPELLIPQKYERKISPLERFLLRSPYASVTMVARTKGEVTEGMLRHAVDKVKLRHPNLRVRITEQADGDAWFTSEGAGDIPIEIVPRESTDHWIQVSHDAFQVPFDFDKRPAIRFILVQSPKISELIIFCHHILCDGLSLAYLARDVLVHLGDPAREVEVLADPVPIDSDNLPQEIAISPIAKFFIERINKKWAEEKIFFDQQDYVDINQAYWENFDHRLLSIELSEEKTSTLVKRCRTEQVTVNSALTAAFTGAQNVVQDEKPFRSSIAVAGSMRDNLNQPVGEVMGFYAGAVTLKYKYNRKIGFWENTRNLHRKVKPLYTDKKLFADPINWCYLAPGILESFPFKIVGGLVSEHATSYGKLSAFSQRDDLVLSMLKREGMLSFENTLLDIAITNLTRMDFPRNYGALELDRLIMNPGGAYPLAMVNLVVGVVTCSGKLSLVLEYENGTVDTPTVESIRDRAMEMLNRS